MAPDINSLGSDTPLSPVSSIPSPSHPRTASVGPDLPLPLRTTPPSASRSGSISLQATAAINASMQTQDSRRSSISSNARGSPQLLRSGQDPSSRNAAMRINLSDPAAPGPGELQTAGAGRRPSQTMFRSSPLGSPVASTADPHHQRAPSIGELYQELEQEQEAQVNRLLLMIRQQQEQLHSLTSSQSASAVDDSTPASEQSLAPTPFPAPTPQPTPLHASTSAGLARNRSPAGIASHRRTSQDRQPSRQSSHRSSRAGSPSMRPSHFRTISTDDVARDESAFYQAETQNLTRENQMLRMRIRELERQVSDVVHAPPNAPPSTSNLAAVEPLLPGQDAAMENGSTS